MSAPRSEQTGRNRQRAPPRPYNNRVNPSPAPIHLLPGALLPAHWLAGQPLDSLLPTIAAALADGRLHAATQVLPTRTAQDGKPGEAPGASMPDGAWAHDHWLCTRPPFAALGLSPQVMGAVRSLLRWTPPAHAPAHVPAPEAARAPAPTPAPARSPGSPHDAPPFWLLQPIQLRPTTDSIQLVPEAGTRVDAPLAERLVSAIAPLLAEDGFAIEILAPDCWLLRPLAGQPGWRLHCTPIEAVGQQHIDALLPTGPDARQFRRLLNEIQMSWHLLSGPDEAELPVNAVWLSGPVPPSARWGRTALAEAHGLIIDERFLTPRLQHDLHGWLTQLDGLDRLYRDSDPARFACLLSGEHSLCWLYAPAVAANGILPASLRPHPGEQAAAPGRVGTNAAQAVGLGQRLRQWAGRLFGGTPSAPSPGGHPSPAAGQLRSILSEIPPDSP